LAQEIFENVSRHNLPAFDLTNQIFSDSFAGKDSRDFVI
jgi:hypothetical protein